MHVKLVLNACGATLWPAEAAEEGRKLMGTNRFWISCYDTPMSFIHVLALLGILLIIGGTFAYIRDTLLGKTKPNRVSFFLWALAPLIGATAGLYAGADGWVTFRVFLAGFMPFLILLASFVNPQSYWKLTRFDSCRCCV